MLINLPDLLASLHPVLAPAAFRSLPRLQQWRRTTESGFQCVILSSAALPDGSQSIELHLGVRHTATEELVFPFTNGLPGFRPNSMTVSVPAWKIMPALSRRWQLKEATDWVELMPQLTRFLEQDGLFFLEKYQFIRSLDELYNAQPEHPCFLVHNQYLRAMRGVGIAHLRQRPDFIELCAAHRRHLVAVMAPDYVRTAFDRLVHHLSGINWN